MSTGLRAITVCVDYSDCLSLTIPYNRHHFQEIMVVTSFTDNKTVTVCEQNNVKVHQTDLFTMYGARFNKWAALEEGLDVFGRQGWLCIMDSDVLWPKELQVECVGKALRLNELHLGCGNLCTPRRRMYPIVPRTPVPEQDWFRYPVHRNEQEFAGYSQIFHASDPVLGPGPWHQTDWAHAGGADSFFQMRWNQKDKVRPSFEVLHLGEAGQNWAGRVTTYADGTVPSEAGDRKRYLETVFAKRQGKQGMDRFKHERL